MYNNSLYPFPLFFFFYFRVLFQEFLILSQNSYQPKEDVKQVSIIPLGRFSQIWLQTLYEALELQLLGTSIFLATHGKPNIEMFR
jgi:hypothetical protein